MDPVDRARLGFDEACDRMTQAGGDIDTAYIAAVEAVTWARSIDEHRESDPSYTTLRSTHPGGGYMVGLRLARNRQIHDLIDGPAEHLEGRRYARRYPYSFRGWHWRRQNEMAPPGRPQNAAASAAYDEHLAGRTVNHTLSQIEEFLRADDAQR